MIHFVLLNLQIRQKKIIWFNLKQKFSLKANTEYLKKSFAEVLILKRHITKN